jgi:hypothetical protein
MAHVPLAPDILEAILMTKVQDQGQPVVEQRPQSNNGQAQTQRPQLQRRDATSDVMGDARGYAPVTSFGFAPVHAGGGQMGSFAGVPASSASSPAPGRRYQDRRRR